MNFIMQPLSGVFYSEAPTNIIQLPPAPVQQANGWEWLPRFIETAYTSSGTKHTDSTRDSYLYKWRRWEKFLRSGLDGSGGFPTISALP